MTKPKISVIIPIYNTGKYLEETLISILNQSMIDDIEVLMIDDGSIDDSRYIIEKYALDYDNFYAFHKENEGQGIARNYGLDIANGEYIHFLDSDDYVVPDAYEKLYGLAVSNNYDFVVGNALRFDRYNCWEEYLFKKSYKDLNRNLEFKNINDCPNLVWDTITCNKLYKKSFLDKNNIRFPNKKIFYEDLFFSIETYIKSELFCFFDEYFYYWRSRNDASSVTQNNSLIKNFKDRLEIILRIKKLFKSDLNTQTLNKLYKKWLIHDLKVFVKRINDYEPKYYDEMRDKIMEIIDDIPQDIKGSLQSYHKIIYKMIENNDINSLLYFAPLEDTLKENPNFELNLNDDYLKLIDFDKDSAEEEFKATLVKIENDENNLYIEFEWHIDFSDDIQPIIESILLDDDNQEYPLEIMENNIILPLKLLEDKKYVNIKMVCTTDSFKKESFLKNNRRRNINFNNINLEMGIGINTRLYITPRELDLNEMIIEDIAFDGKHFIFNGSSEFDVKDVIIENIINFKKFTYPIHLNNNNFNFKIPYSDIIKFPIKKWELKCNYLISLAKPFRFFRYHDEIFFSNQRNIILIEDDVYDIIEKLNKLDENLNSATQTNRMLSQKNQKLTDDNNKFKKRNSNLTNKNNKLKERNNKLQEKNEKLKHKNEKLKDTNTKLKDKNKNLSNTIDEYKSRKIVKVVDKFKQ